MYRQRISALLTGCLLLAGMLQPVWAQSKHFQTSQRHFEDLAALAATLATDLDAPGEKNACNYFTATAMTYAIRAHALAQLSDVASQVKLPEEKTLLRQKLAETQTYASRYIQGDLKVLEGLASSSKNSRIRDIGMRLINELRVFDNNASSAVKG